MFDKFFGSTNKSESLRNIFSTHEQNSYTKLHQNHPHLRELLDRHNIDLKNIRKNSVKIGAAAAVLGAFLAIPFLLGHPNQDQQPPQGVENSHTSPPQDASVLNPEGRSQPSGIRISPSAQIDSQGAQGSSGQKDGSGSFPGGVGDGSLESKSQGHKYGRSYLAPPKEHGLHDLGLHKGEDKGKGAGKGHEGAHPEDLEINHPEKGEEV